jgi:hypothetical protein
VVSQNEMKLVSASSGVQKKFSFIYKILLLFVKPPSEMINVHKYIKNIGGDI